MISPTLPPGWVGEETLREMLAGLEDATPAPWFDPPSDEQWTADIAEACAEIADLWSDPSALRLAAGEMTAQELRTAQAVARGVAAAIRHRYGKEGM